MTPRDLKPQVFIQSNIDLAFDMKLCLTNDIISGMVYLNKSSLGYHGRLSSRNCLIDGHFKLKIGDIDTILTDQFSKKSIPANEMEKEAFLESLLWVKKLIKNFEIRNYFSF